MINVIIADDHTIVREGLKQILDNEVDVEVADEASNGQGLIRKILKNDYHVVLLDISMPGRNGIEILKEIKQLKPKLPVLILSMYPEEHPAGC